MLEDLIKDLVFGKPSTLKTKNGKAYIWYENETYFGLTIFGIAIKGYDFTYILNETLGLDEARVCSHCGNKFWQGYCVNGGDEYYCSDECLHEHFTIDEWEEECYSNEDSYYTEWEEGFTDEEAEEIRQKYFG